MLLSFDQRSVMKATTGDPDDAQKKPDKKSAELAQAKGEWKGFQSRHEGTMNAYYGTKDVRFTMKPGGWYIDLEKLEVNADPNFFLEKGYTEAEALFASFHEGGHFDDMVQDSEHYLGFFERTKMLRSIHPAYPKAVQRLYNCVEDVLVNKKVIARWAAGAAAKNSLYPKLFPSNDFRGQPRHRQLMYVLLREAMLPDQPCFIGDEVRDAVNVWQKNGGRKKALDVLTAVDYQGKAVRGVKERFMQYQRTLEPIFLDFFLKDLQDRKEQDKEKEKGEKGEKGDGDPERSNEPGEPGDEDPFGDDPNKDGIPDPIDMDDLADQVKKLNKNIAQKKKDAFKDAMGVDQKDFEDYQKDARAVAPYVESMSKVFDRVIQKRKTYRRILNKPFDEGAILNPARLASIPAEIAAGNDPHEAFLGFRSKEVIRNRPDELEFTLVGDGSGSMYEGQEALPEAQRKDVMQRKIAVLIQEGLQRFRDRITKERRAGEKINLVVRGEVRIFNSDDHRIVSLSDNFTHKDRVTMRKALKNLKGIPGSGSNNEPATFEAIIAEQLGEATIKKLQQGKLKKVILFLSDGQTDTATIQGYIQDIMARVGPAGAQNLIIAGIGFIDGKQTIETYAPNGHFVERLQDVPDKFIEFFKKVLEGV